jgi:hypothetical protein
MTSGAKQMIRQVISDIVEDFLTRIRAQVPSCEEKSEARNRVKEDLLVRSGRRARLNPREREMARNDIRTLIAHGLSTGNSVKRIAQKYGIPERTMRGYWDRRS